MRCAVVCTAAGGIPEAVRHGQNGLLVDVEHPERLTECVLEVFRSPSLSRCLGDAARATVEDEFSVRRMAREVEETYERVIDGYHGV
jgi:glycosyltransferase involved in cell wall biosynthesis